MMVRLCFAATFLAATAIAGAASLESPEPDLGWRAVNRCGPNALYVMLFMHGLKPDYQKLIADISITEQGASISELVRTSANHGLPLAAIKTTVEHLSEFSTPALIHYQPPGELGHYAVLLRVNPDRTFTTIEATRGSVEVQSLGDFQSQWSGIVLVRKADWDAWQFDRYLVPCSALVAAASLLIMVYLYGKARFHRLRTINEGLRKA